ncbi:class I SAM-dependent methyltransferase [bacterium]|nr:class I SAM-dependent methyltransferase [bacterium]
MPDPSIANLEIDFKTVADAFTRQSTYFDDYEVHNPILQWMRKQVWQHVESFLKPNSRILELNAGTGIDAVHFAQLGHVVHATDISEGMLLQLRNKVQQYQLEKQITFQQCSFTELDQISQQPFDYIFSNFGGLNCIDDLKVVTQHLPRLLRTGGMVTWVILPRICPWEMMMVLKNHLKLATRRFKKGGSSAHIEGLYFKCFYHSPASVVQAFGRNFELIKLQGLASLSPPPYLDDFAKKFPRAYRLLTLLDEKTSAYFPFNHCADHYILTVHIATKSTVQ